MVNRTSHEDGMVVGVFPPVEQVTEDASVEVMRLLGEHVPLTLLADLAQPEGPRSPDILQAEGLPEVAWWE